MTEHERAEVLQRQVFALAERLLVLEAYVAHVRTVHHLPRRDCCRDPHPEIHSFRTPPRADDSPLLVLADLGGTP